MKLEIVALPEGAKLRRQNKSCKALMQAVADAKGQWVAVGLSDIAGAPPALKQITVEAAAKYRRMQIDTSVHGDRLYVRLKDQANA